MKTSSERILTTHVGSLPRSKAVTDYVFAHEKGEVTDHDAMNATIRAAVADTVAKQVKSKVDIVSDGEMSKISYVKSYLFDPRIQKKKEMLVPKDALFTHLEEKEILNSHLKQEV